MREDNLATKYEERQKSDLLKQKYCDLKNILRSLGKVAVAFSGGVDSTFLLKVAHDELKEGAVALTADMCSFPERELIAAKDFCAKEGIRQIIVPFDALALKEFYENGNRRCYYCKREILGKFITVAANEGFHILAEGSNMDDENDYRPGRKAVDELGVKSPLQSVGLYKNEIRALSKELGLSTWNKHSAACLATRIPTGTPITKEALSMAERAEDFLHDLGFGQVRVRIHNKLARIETEPEEFPMFLAEDMRQKITTKFKEYGFQYISLDLTGYSKRPALDPARFTL